MPRLEGYGHEQRLAQAKRAFKRSRAGRPINLSRKLLNRLRGGAGLLLLGAGIGASAVILLDAAQPSSKAVTATAGPYYSSCRDAFQDGRANILRGEPSYRAELDADSDGKACEPFMPTRR
jgi:cystathionine beta-lyase/cystathionine gamma-synthase